MHTPRLWEAVLEGFGAGRAYTQDLVGDLAEEFARRAEQDGERLARRWYRAQALRSLPHLLVDWLRTARRKDYKSVLTAVWITYFSVVVVVLMVAATLFATLHRFGLSSSGHARLSVASIAVLGVVAVVALPCGYIAAALCQDAR